MLAVTDIHTYYGAGHILRGVSLEVGAGQVVSLLGRNGMGKTTTIRSIIGLTPPRSGKIRFKSEDVTGLPSHAIARRGLAVVPEGRGVFPNLSVLENLTMAARRRPTTHGAQYDLAAAYELFPRLAERAQNMGDQLSGGEQQMLAIARALLTNPDLLLLDEATEGLAPQVRREIYVVIKTLKARGQSILIVDKNLRNLLEVCDHHYVLVKGKIAWSGTSAALAAAADVQHRFLGV